MVRTPNFPLLSRRHNSIVQLSHQENHITPQNKMKLQFFIDKSV